MAMNINNNPQLANQMVRQASQRGQSAAAANTGVNSKIAKENKAEQAQDGIDKQTLERLALKDAEQSGMNQVADENAQTNKGRRKNEDPDVQDSHIQGGQYFQEGEVSGASTGQEEEFIELTATQESAIDKMDSPAFSQNLNSDIPESSLKPAAAKVEAELKAKGPEAMDFKEDPKVIEITGQVETGLTESLMEAGGKPNLELHDATTDKNFQPQLAEDPYSEELAKTAVAEQLANGELEEESHIAS